jgi:hypothetical protein
MLLDALNLNNNSLVGLPADYFYSCFSTSQTYITAAGNTAIIPQEDLLATDTTNFLLGIPFAADSSHMEGFARTGNDVNWATSGKCQLHPLTGTPAVGLGNSNGTAMANVFPPVCYYFSAVCNWNL